MKVSPMQFSKTRKLTGGPRMPDSSAKEATFYRMQSVVVVLGGLQIIRQCLCKSAECEHGRGQGVKILLMEGGSFVRVHGEV